jgi:hypothetical protein
VALRNSSASEKCSHITSVKIPALQNDKNIKHIEIYLIPNIRYPGTQQIEMKD